MALPGFCSGEAGGAAKAAERAGELDKARKHYAAVVALTENADPIRDDIAAARASMTRSN